MSQLASRPVGLLGQLFHFAFSTVVPAAPAALWWTIGLGLFSLLNLIFQQEIWMHTPHAEKWFALLGLGCLLLLPWQAAQTAGRVAELLRNSLWRFLWRLVSWGAYLGGGLVLIPGIICCCYLLITAF
jgi:hypothetical protein